jgi:hypothetical protein
MDELFRRVDGFPAGCEEVRWRIVVQDDDFHEEDEGGYLSLRVTSPAKFFFSSTGVMT